LTIEEIIADIGNSDKPLLNSRLIELSDLSSQELGVLKQAWLSIEPKRRCQIISRLVELARDNLEYNFDGVFKNCLEDKNANVRSEAIEGLWESEEPSLIDPLVNMLEKDSSEEVQIAAAMALSKFAMLAEYGKLNSTYTAKIGQALLGVISDRSRSMEVQRRALEAAAPLSLPQVKEAIAEAYQSHDAKLKVSSIYSMGKSCDPYWLSILLKELSNADAEIRYEAAGACGELEEEEAVPQLVELIDDSDIDVQLTAIQSLGKIGGTKAKECLKERLDNSSVAIRQAAEQALQELQEQEDLSSFDM
jgi:HEAT repeat protein